MTNVEIAELVDSTNMYDIAYKTNHALELNVEEKEAASLLDAHFKEIGKRGCDPDHEISSFVQKVINEEIYNTPDELLDRIFDRGTIGEFDDYENITTPKNTLIAYEAAKGGNVPRSYLDVSVLTPTWKNKQLETDISYRDLARNGWKNIALITSYATDAFKNTMFAEIFSTIDTGITSGGNFINAAGTKPTSTEMDQVALYINDRAERGEGVIVALSKYIQAVSKFTGFVSDELINEVHRTGRLGTYDGISLVPISSAKKLGSGNLLIPDSRIFGICGKVGTLDMKGEIKTYQDADNNKEVYHLMFKDFTFGYGFNAQALENIIKVDLS